MKFVSSLKQALTFHFVIAAVSPVLLFALVATVYVSDYLIDDVSRDNIFLAGELRAQTSDFLNYPVAVMEHISDVVYAEGKIADAQIDAYLEKEVYSSDFFESIYILNQQGRVKHLGVNRKLAEQKQDYYSIDLSSHELFKGRLEQGEIFWSDTFISVVTGEPSITIVLPFYQDILVGNLSLNRLNKIVARFTYADNLLFAILDRKGALIAHSDPQKVLQRDNMTFHPEVIRALESGEEIKLHIHEDQTMIESVIRFEETGWVIWVGRNRDAVLAPVYGVRSFMLLILAGSFLIGVVLSIVNSRRMMRPISGLVDDISSLADGNYDFKPTLKSYREINELADGFNQMSLAVIDREKSILDRERRFRNLVNSIEGIVWEFELDQDAFVFVSRQCEEILGCHHSQWLDSADFWLKHVHPDDRQWVTDYFKGLSQGRLSPQFEYRMVDTSGRVIWVRNMVNVVYEATRPVRLYGVIIDINIRKNSEIALRESEVRFRSLVEQAADIILIHDQTGRFIEVNEQACRSLGYSRDELLGMSVQDIEGSHDSLQYNSLWNTVRHGNPVTIDGNYKRRDGSIFPVEIRLGSFTFHDSPLYLGLVRDISERRKAESALRESEERFRNYFELGLIGMSLRDRDGKFIQFNDRLCEIVGYDREELLEKTWLDITHPDDREESLREIEQLLTGKTQRLSMEKRYIRKNGQIVDAGISVIGIKNADGIIDHTIAVAEDITLRKRAEKAQQESEEQVRLLLNSTAEGIYGIGPEGHCTFCNPAGLKILGYNEEADLLGQNMHDLIHHSSIDGKRMDEKDCRIFLAFCETESTHSDEEVFWRADNSWFHVEYWAHPITKDEETIGAVVTFHDITERKQLQQQSIRTAQLASLGELAAGVAHEINNPINGVINYAQILLNRLEKSGLETDLADRIIKEGERIATIVKDLLFFAREGGPETKLSDIGDVLSEALSLTEAQIRKEGILLSVDIGDRLPMVSTRAQQIQQLFLNVLSNARHALIDKYPGHDEKKIIEVRIKSISKKRKAYVQVIFRDYGAGISPEMLAKVMNPFVTSKPAGVGTGLGLSISHEIVKNHDGEIRIDSRAGEWTEVVIELPASEKVKK